MPVRYDTIIACFLYWADIVIVYITYLDILYILLCLLIGTEACSLITHIKLFSTSPISAHSQKGDDMQYLMDKADVSY